MEVAQYVYFGTLTARSGRNKWSPIESGTEKKLSMSTTFKRATSDEKMSQTMVDFCDYFAEKLELKK